MRIVVFGAGKFYQKRKKILQSYMDVEQIAIIDNDKNIQGTVFDDVPIFAVEQVIMMEFDKVLLMGAKTVEMRKQLLSLGVEPSKIWYWERFISERVHGHFDLYCGNPNFFSVGKRVLIITTVLGYNGGSLAAVYAAKALGNLNYNVVLAAPEGNDVFINEMKQDGINIILCSALPYLYQEEIAFIKQFDFVIANVFPMILCASEISNIKPVLWWIHEAGTLYEPILNQFSEYAKEEKLNKIDIYAVSRIAQENFNRYFPNRITKTLTYGIPDESRPVESKGKNNKIVFAIIGVVCPPKAQDIFLGAIKRVQPQLKKDALFWIVGLIRQDSYNHKVRELASQEANVTLMGELTRDEIKKVYQDIDVLVCASLEETLSIVATEAMMYGKTCIVSDRTGIADYISDGINGFIFKSGDEDALAEKINWIFMNQKLLPQIGKNARQTYEEYFTMDHFGERLEKALLKKY